MHRRLWRDLFFSYHHLFGMHLDSIDPHTRTGDGVLLGAGATILGNVKVGAGSLVGACSLVLDDIMPHSVAVGVPAKVVGQTTDANPEQSMRQADAIVSVEEDLPDFII